jgi:hypothetical protein
MIAADVRPWKRTAPIQIDARWMLFVSTSNRFVVIIQDEFKCLTNASETKAIELLDSNYTL